MLVGSTAGVKHVIAQTSSKAAFWRNEARLPEALEAVFCEKLASFVATPAFEDV
jgi:hypothetical protein